MKIILLIPLLMLFSVSFINGRAQTADTPIKLEHFDPNQADRRLDPCQDFYQFACHKWFAANPIPADQAFWDTASNLQLWNETILRETMQAASAKSASRTPVQQKIGDFWSACIDEKTIDVAGMRDLNPELRRIDALGTKSDLADEIAHLHTTVPAAWQPDDNQTPAPLFGFGSNQDLDDASLVIILIDQGGMGLPGRDFYLNEDSKSVALRSQYRQHIEKMLSLTGRSSVAAAGDAEKVLVIETGMAKAAMDNVSRRDPKNLNNKLSLAQVQALTPSFDWKRYISLVGAPAPHHYIVSSPQFFKQLEQLLQQHSLEEWKAYLRWHLVHASAPYLPTAFVNEDFEFYSRTLSGIQEQLPRWRRCVRSADRNLGEALGQAYVERAFPPESKGRAVELVMDVEAALDRDIDGLDWMTPPTRKAAHEKLQGIEDKIGYPGHWRDYSSLSITASSYLNNIHEATAFEFKRRLAKVNKPVDRTEWQMTPPTIDAYYDAQLNTINFPAGILQPPLFDPQADAAVNYGAIGAVIGHEITHGFDDQGRKFDARGNLNDWWNAQDAKSYEERGNCIAEEYSVEVPEAGVKQNGHLTQGEDTADNGGTRLALMALERRLQKDGIKLDDRATDGWSPRQRFFLSYANAWCTEARPEAIRTQVLTNPHSFARYRVNNVVSNMPEFRQAFGCTKGSPMVRENACRVW
jgi:putative endopeptidase